jgi:hypothetical protein
MRVRESLNRHSGRAAAVTVAVVAGALLFRYLTAGAGPGANGPSNRAFFSNDDGKTWFVDDVHKLPPFQKDGKDAYRAFVYQCADGKKFVAYLQRYTQGAKQKLGRGGPAAVQGPGALPGADGGGGGFGDAAGVEVKKPGAESWVSQADPRAVEVMTLKCPGGSSPTLVQP